MQPGLSTKNAPSIWVVAPHFLVGTLVFLIATMMLAFNQDALLTITLVDSYWRLFTY
jgi:hypothetical protein